MAQRKGQIHIGLWLTMFDGQAGWRLPGSRVEEFFRLEPYVELVELAERGKLDAVIRADSLASAPDIAQRHPLFSSFEPISLLSALAARSSKVGLIGTMSTTFNEPYNVARQMGSLDHLSNGRAGWNIVTSFGGERNFGDSELPDQEVRYERAEEFVDVVTALWDSWEPDAVVADRETGLYADPARIHRIDHVGKHFTVDGPLNMQRTPQGRPVFVQAGSSGRGRDFAAKHAEVIFTAAPTREEAHEFYTDVKHRAAEHGRDPELVKILPGVMLYIAESDAMAQALVERRLAFANYDEGRRGLEKELGGVDLTGIELDELIPADRLPDPTTLSRRQSRPQLYVDLALKQGYTLRRLIQMVITTNGHSQVIGGPETVAAHLIDWYRSEAADGFVVFPGSGIEGVRLFVDHVIPILRAEGLFREDYEGTTLREHLGLPALTRR